MGASWADPKIKKFIVLKCRLVLFYATTMSHFSIGLWPAMKSGLYMTTDDDQFSGLRSSKTLPKVNLVLEKGHGHYLVVCCPSDPLQLSESWWNHYIWEVCSANWWDAPKTVIGQYNGSILLHNNAQPHVAQPAFRKLNELGYRVLPHLPYSPDHFFKHLNILQGKRFHNQQKAGSAFQELVKSWSIHFYAARINELISHWQKCVDCNGSYFD